MVRVTGRSLLVLIPAMIAVSALIVFVGHQWGVAKDCVAQGVKQDGQCGLATGMGDLFGLGAGAMFFFIATIALVILWRRGQVAKENAE